MAESLQLIFEVFAYVQLVISILLVYSIWLWENAISKDSAFLLVIWIIHIFFVHEVYQKSFNYKIRTIKD